MTEKDISRKIWQGCPLCGTKPTHVSILEGKLLLPLYRFLVECSCISSDRGVHLMLSFPLSEEERQEAFREAMQMIRNIEFMPEEN